MRKHLQLPCAFTLATQTAFSEPRIRFNTSFLSPSYYSWDEEEFGKNTPYFILNQPQEWDLGCAKTPAVRDHKSLRIV